MNVETGYLAPAALVHPGRDPRVHGRLVDAPETFCGEPILQPIDFQYVYRGEGLDHLNCERCRRSRLRLAIAAVVSARRTLAEELTLPQLAQAGVVE